MWLLVFVVSPFPLALLVAWGSIPLRIKAPGVLPAESRLFSPVSLILYKPGILELQLASLILYKLGISESQLVFCTLVTHPFYTLQDASARHCPGDCLALCQCLRRKPCAKRLSYTRMLTFRWQCSCKYGGMTTAMNPGCSICGHYRCSSCNIETQSVNANA